MSSKGSLKASISIRVLCLGFRVIGGTFFWGPYNKDPTIQGTILGSLFSETPI